MSETFGVVDKDKKERRCFGEFDVAVIGAGHAGCEAALAAAKMGFKTVVFAVTLDGIANMACNPSIGGTAKGQLVREIDALGGTMGRAADATAIQVRFLNRGKGPAVYSPRAQIDRRQYQIYMKHELEKTPNLSLKQGEIVEIVTEPAPEGGETGKKYKVCGVVTHLGAFYRCKCVVACTGTYLKGRVIIGETSYSSGPDGQFPANRLSESIKALGHTIIRLKTGTPPRVNGLTVDYSKTEVQYGDEPPFTFQFDPEEKQDVRGVAGGGAQIPCYLTHTNRRTHEIIKQNLHRSPLFNGMIEGVGPRYCPSIEDKIMRFADKDRHQIFLEPLGRETEEIYLQGLSSSLPEDVQLDFVHSIAGLENASVMRPAYAIEYDAIDARELELSLESKLADGLFCAGQINGSSGYEEAAGQGLIAGINAALKLRGEEPLVLDRSEAYIGVLIDDLVTRGTKEPYRMMTSRAEYRLILRQDNADARLTEKGHRIGLISDERYERFLLRKKHVEDAVKKLETTFIGPASGVNSLLADIGSAELHAGASAADLLRRPEITLNELKKMFPDMAEVNELTPVEAEQVEIVVKYSGYIQRELLQVEQFRKRERQRIPAEIDYLKVPSISNEAREKLGKIRPASIGQAMRITGVSPADIAALMIYLKKYSSEAENCASEAQKDAVEGEVC